MLKYVHSFWILISFTIFFTDCSNAPKLIALEEGLRIKKSCTVEEAFYQIENTASTEFGTIIITGSDIEIDFNNAILSGAIKATPPDDFRGIGIEIREGSNITLKNLKVRGYKIGLKAKDVDKLQLINCDFSYNYREKLSVLPNSVSLSAQLGESINSATILKHGTAIYLENCSDALLKESKITNGQNGLLLDKCQGVLCFNNEIQYNSGLGVTLLFSDANRIMHNKLDWNVGDNHKVTYKTNTLSGGILSDKSSQHNQFAYNSITHSGEALSYWLNQIVDTTNVFHQNNLSNVIGPIIDSTFKQQTLPPLLEGMNTQLSPDVLQGASYILMQQWGPYNFSSPEIYLREIDDQETHVYLLMGPQGNWKAAGGKGFQSLNPKSGTFPATLRARPINDADTLEIKIEFIGEAFLDQFGFENKKGNPYSFGSLLIKENKNEQISPQ